MIPRLPVLAFLLAAMAFTPPTGASPSSTKYYESGKQIPTPLQVPPIYPPKEFKRRIGGTAIIAYSFDQNGKVVAASVKTSSGNKNLDAAAVAAVKQWTVTPPLKDGQPQAGESDTPVTFTP